MILTLLACVPHPVDVEILGAVVGPSTTDLQAWDGIGHISPADRQKAIDSAAEVDPTVGQATAAFLSFLDATAAPDPAGDAATGTPQQRVALVENADTFTPRWTGATLRGLRLQDRPTVTLRLLDQDLDAPDPIATVTLDAARLKAAWRAHKPWAIDTAAETGGQLLWVTVEVRRSED